MKTYGRYIVVTSGMWVMRNVKYTVVAKCDEVLPPLDTEKIRVKYCNYFNTFVVRSTFR